MRQLARNAVCATLLLLTPAAAQDGASFPRGQQANEWIAGRLPGSAVVAANGEDVGVVNDVVVGKDGTVTALLVSMGGFLGIGERVIAVPFRSISVGPIVNSRRVVRVDLPRTVLQRAPSFEATDPTFTDRLGERATEWGNRAMELGRNASERVSEIVREQQAREAEARRRVEMGERRDDAGRDRPSYEDNASASRGEARGDSGRDRR